MSNREILYASRARRGQARGQNQKIIIFILFFLELLAKTSIFEFPRPRRSFPAIRELMKPIPDRTRDENVYKIFQNEGFQQFPTVTEGLPRVPDGFQSSPRASMMSEGSQPVAPTLHACQEKMITECRPKIDHRVSAQN